MVGASYERDPVRCVYIPINHGRNDIVALGRIAGNGDPIVTDGGGFAVTKSDEVGEWCLSIPGHSPQTGTLILTPEGGDANNVDKIWSYEWDPAAKHWVILSRDIERTGNPAPTGDEDMSRDDEPAFSFVFVTTETRVIHLDKMAASGGDGASWATAYQELSEALADLQIGDEIWIAEGTYLPASEDGFIIDETNVKIYGGFPTGGGDGTFSARNPDPETNNTVLSGDLDTDEDRIFFRQTFSPGP